MVGTVHRRVEAPSQGLLDRYTAVRRNRIDWGNADQSRCLGSRVHWRAPRARVHSVTRTQRSPVHATSRCMAGVDSTLEYNPALSSLMPAKRYAMPLTFILNFAATCEFARFSPAVRVKSTQSASVLGIATVKLRRRLVPTHACRPRPWVDNTRETIGNRISTVTRLNRQHDTVKSHDRRQLSP